MDEPTPAPHRRRGRPPKSAGLVTAQRLLEAATEVCAEWGYDGATLARVAERAQVSPTAIYNHYSSKEELIYAAAVQGLDRITSMAGMVADSTDVTAELAAAYLRPEMRDTRRLLAEIHLASNRDERLAALLADWHRLWSNAMLERLPEDDPSPKVTVKLTFMLLLGLCHFDDLPAVRAPRAAVAERAGLLLAAIAELDSPEPRS
jgi:AcrR family transcriptional regulator